VTQSARIKTKAQFLADRIARSVTDRQTDRQTLVCLRLSVGDAVHCG